MRRQNQDIDFGDPTNPRRWRKLRPEDAAVWAGFLEAAIPPVEETEFDVLIGPGLPAPLGASEAEVRMIGELSRQEMDVVFVRQGRIFAAEIKPRVDLGALGQAYFGTILLSESYPALSMAEPTVIAWSIQAGLTALAESAGIIVHLVQPPEELAL